MEYVDVHAMAAIRGQQRSLSKVFNTGEIRKGVWTETAVRTQYILGFRYMRVNGFWRLLVRFSVST